ncbi:synapse-associated protein of 47 kDa [Neltuma alba]|uniref:synapse-associated protein of 47 kDa n=1 Tax=Neltuma alba TaxID=207710 RepID=UPI0010A471B6|nr:synapse-associated protein of 47 kDa-like [Prosopis alba]XP_028780918.1 synapse-associated protein of 47 kDa-like [Prosopis alba]
MDFWNKARSLAEEAAKRSQDLSFGTSTFSHIVVETTKRSKEIVSEASKRADQIRIEALKRADHFKHLAQGIHPPGGGLAESYEVSCTQEKELERFGITEELREFVKGITPSTFRDFPLEDDTYLSDVPAVSNVRKDLTEWQEKHANLVLSTVKEISKLRYELCPRVMKERKFWRIYFILMNSHISPYEKRYMEDAKLESSEQAEDREAIEPREKEVKDREAIKPPEEQVKIEKVIEPPEAGRTSLQEELEVKKESRTSSAEQDLDEFLLGDVGEIDDDPDDGNGDFDDDLDKLVDTSDDEKGES